MRVLVIGLGSMGKRRIRLMKQHFGTVSVCGFDTAENRRTEAGAAFDIPVFATVEAAFAEQPDCVFVCSAPLSHSQIITRCLSAGLHVFTELNLVNDGYAENMALAKEKGKILFMSSTCLYRKDICYLTDRVSGSASPLLYTYHVGQYLPDWHPWESHKDFFVGEKRTGGCREILAAELPWMLRAFGAIVKTESGGYTMSSLGLPYPDTYLIRLEHLGGSVGQLTVDVVSKVPVRHLEVFGESVQLEWRGKPEEVWEAEPDYTGMRRIDLGGSAQRQSGYRDFIVEDAYREEIRAFFETVRGAHKPVYTFEDDLYTLRLVDTIVGAEY